MNRVAWLSLLSMLLIIGSASAAYIEFNAPDQVRVGVPLVVNGTSVPSGFSTPTLNPGFSTEIILYYAPYTKREIARNTIYIRQDGSFQTTFETTGLEKGPYTLELVDPDRKTFGSSSTLRRSLTLIDRSGDLAITSPRTQDFDGNLRIAGTLMNQKGQSIQIRAEDASGIVFGPEFVATGSRGAFVLNAPIAGSGTYHVFFYDAGEYVDTVEFRVTDPGAPVITPVQTPDTGATPAGADASGGQQAAPLSVFLPLLALFVLVIFRQR